MLVYVSVKLGRILNLDGLVGLWIQMSARGLVQKHLLDFSSVDFFKKQISLQESMITKITHK